jgi:hypothetical protein
MYQRLILDLPFVRKERKGSRVAADGQTDTQPNLFGASFSCLLLVVSAAAAASIARLRCLPHHFISQHWSSSSSPHCSYSIRNNMPTPSRQKRAPQADEEAFDSEVFDKENEMNGGAGSGSAGKRKQSPDDGDDNEDHVQQQANDIDNDDSPRSPPPKHSKKKSKKSASFAAATSDSPMKDRHINPTGKPAEAGIIHEVYVENFMCHRKLSVKLCRNVNFIHGQNGSGKSAILAAIQVCLGAGARRTHRARNLKDLVRKEAGADCAGAKLRVTLLNKGADGYMPEVYGDYITVERMISLRSGGFNGYKLLDSTGKERSRSKKDLDAMLDQLNIQVENPVAVLDQEEAKKFLTGKAEDKYEFFTKATELERLDRVYASITDNILEQKATRERALENIQGSIENTRQLKKEWEQFQELDKLEVEVQELRANYGWSVHGEFREQLQEEMKVRRGGRFYSIVIIHAYLKISPGLFVIVASIYHRKPKSTPRHLRNVVWNTPQPNNPSLSPTIKRWR